LIAIDVSLRTRCSFEQRGNDGRNIRGVYDAVAIGIAVHCLCQQWQRTDADAKQAAQQHARRPPSDLLA